MSCQMAIRQTMLSTQWLVKDPERSSVRGEHEICSSTSQVKAFSIHSDLMAIPHYQWHMGGTLLGDSHDGQHCFECCSRMLQASCSHMSVLAYQQSICSNVPKSSLSSVYCPYMLPASSLGTLIITSCMPLATTKGKTRKSFAQWLVHG
jgi:hypothetical protein